MGVPCAPQKSGPLRDEILDTPLFDVHISLYLRIASCTLLTSETQWCLCQLDNFISKSYLPKTNGTENHNFGFNDLCSLNRWPELAKKLFRNHFRRTTPFYPQIKITGVQIKIAGVQSKATGVQIKTTAVQIKTLGVQIKTTEVQIKMTGVQFKTREIISNFHVYG